MTFEAGNDLGLYSYVLDEVRTQSRGSLQEAVADRSSVARRVLADVCRRPPPGRVCGG